MFRRSLLALALAGPPAWATPPKPLGHFGDWQVASHAEAGVVVCYAFTRGAAHPEIVLTVTRRPAQHDAVAVSLGYRPFERKGAWLQFGPTRVGLYVAGRSAFVRDGASAIAVMTGDLHADANFPARNEGRVSETFSLRGFVAAYRAAGGGCAAA